AAAVPASGLLGLPWLVIAALHSGQGVLWAFAAICVVLLGGGAYAFGRAALAQQVRCARDGVLIRARTRTESVEAAVAHVRVELGRRRVGLNPPVTLHLVTLRAPGWREPIPLHSGLTPWSARAAATRISLHLGLAEPRERSTT
ncbi:MAG TPA: hypothetical protein VFZ61_21925, partial [Polyangiales bacterium]